ncbi:ATP-grasp domain-containing protein [Micromonospora ureilytica]|uniref:Biotin carboxylase n=1 Tax=Micromonospora ureilytica TaxID=709868 RepID=A0ABS0JD48_9ACTN|nr:ATP-grasp domain-containing protein [Micromonospora ureilytica]MBG6064451.1 biotin carboxylase [Micromonospora ureilytica]WSR55889.1 ATP-grasp domain-containing protein [Micromonospora ureilytica]
MTSDIVVIVDAYSSARDLAPIFRERGFRCVHVRSVANPHPVYGRSFQAGDFIADIVHDGDVAATAAAVERHSPACLIPGTESGVELADILSERLGLRSNGTALGSARRDKYRMLETVRAAGVPTARQMLVSDLDTLLDWYDGFDGRVVLKPVRSAGNDGIHFCADADDLKSAFSALIGTDSALGARNNAVLAQEYLVGGEYIVNTVSLDGIHRVTDIWRMHHISANGVRDLGGSAQLMPRHGLEQNALADYTIRVLDALGLRHGPAHTELKLTPQGPRLIETAARACGADLHIPVKAAIGASQLDWTVDAYTGAVDLHRAATSEYSLIRHAGLVNMVAPVSGKLLGYPKMEQLRGLDSFHALALNVQPGGQIHRSVDDWTYPMRVYLVHEQESRVMNDILTARYLDGDGFYQVEPSAAAV